MKKFAVIAILFLTTACTAMFADKWNSWIGHTWQDFNNAGPNANCYVSSPQRVTCYAANGHPLIWHIDNNGIITGWEG